MRRKMEEHEHSHEGDDHHHRPHTHSRWSDIRALLHLDAHSHGHDDLAADPAFRDNAAGIRTVWLALAAMVLTSIVQLAILSVSGSVALLGDTVHNIGDGLNSIPLLVAFYVVRRAATRRYTYGFGRAEDLAGVVIVLSIAFSAGLILWESFQKLLHPQPLANLGWLVVAGVVGFLGNETVALLQIRMGKRIGSAALVADGLHARSDALTSLAVLAAAAGSWLGYPIIDPLVGLLMGVIVLFVAWDAAKAVWYRLMDAIDPGLLAEAETIARGQSGVLALKRLRMRWVGHRLHAEAHIAVDPQQTVAEGHRVAEDVRHALFHRIPNLSEVVVHVDPRAGLDDEYHALTVHHERLPAMIE